MVHHLITYQVIPAFDEAVASMKLGGIRRIIVPTDIGYPDNDWKKKDPKPSTFAVSYHLSPSCAPLSTVVLTSLLLSLLLLFFLSRVNDL